VPVSWAEKRAISAQKAHCRPRWTNGSRERFAQQERQTQCAGGVGVALGLIVASPASAIAPAKKSRAQSLEGTIK
jgi:hypothetical protein